MTELHVILFISIVLTVFSHLLNNKKAKFFVRTLVVFWSVFSLTVVLLGYRYAFTTDFSWIQDYIRLSISPFSFFCFLVIGLTTLYGYRFFFKKDNEGRIFKASFDLVLISSLLVSLSSSLFVYVMMIELISLIIVPSMVINNNVEDEEGLSDISLYQMSIIVIVPVIAAFSIMYSSQSEFIKLLNLDLAALKVIESRSVPEAGFWASILLLIYFIARFSLSFFLAFSSIDKSRTSAVSIPILMSLLLIGFVKFIKPLVDLYHFFSFSYFSCFVLMMFAFLASDFRSKDQGKFYIKKSFQLCVLLMLSALFPGVLIEDSFYEASSVLLITALFLSIGYSGRYHLSIITEVKKSGAWGLGLLASLLLIIINLSPMPFTPIVYSIYENLQVVLKNSLLASMLILCVYGVITLPVLYQLQYVQGSKEAEERVTLNISSFFYIFLYIFLIVFMSWGE